MPTEDEIVGIDFTQGLDTRTDERLVLKGKLTRLENASLSKANSIQRRDAWTQLVTNGGGALSGLAAFNNELLAINGASLLSFNKQGAALVSKGNISNFTLSKQPLVRMTISVDSFDMATGGGYSCFVYRTLNQDGSVGSAYCMVIEEASGDVVLGPSALGQGAMYAPRVVAISNAFILFYTYGTANLIGRVIQFSSPSTLGGEVVLRTDVNTTGANGPFWLDACAFNGVAAVVYPGGGGDVGVIMVTQTGGTSSVFHGPTALTPTNVSSANTINACVAAFSSSAIGVYIVGTDSGITTRLYGAVLDGSLTVLAAPAALDFAHSSGGTSQANHVTAVLVGSTMQVYWDRFGEVPSNLTLLPIRSVSVNSSNAITSGPAVFSNGSGGTGGSPQTCGPFIAGKAFTVSSAAYLPVCIIENPLTGLGQQNAWFLLNGSAQVVAKALYGTYGPTAGTPFSTGSMMIPSTPTLSSGKVSVCVPERTILSFAAGLNVSVNGMSRLLLSASSAPPTKAQVGQDLFFAGALMTIYDGQNVTEAGFHLFPEGLTVATGAAGSIPAGTYQYVALYEWVDAAGQRHQSAPCPAVTWTNSGNNKANLTVPNLLLFARQNATIVFYRTTNNGTTFFRVNAVNSPLFNTTLQNDNTYTDNTTDATLQTQELLYTTGGTLPNNSPPPCSACWVHQNRLWIDVGDDPYAFRFSQVAVSGFGLQWNEALGGRLPPESGGVVMGAPLDGNNIIFGARKIYAIYGTGPDATGSNSSYSNPQELPSDVGCGEPRSVLKMPFGIIFKSNGRGWHLLTRNLTVEYIGEGVAAYDANSVSAAVLVEDRKECRFMSTSGRTLVYSYLTHQWSTHLNYAAADALWWAAGGAFVHCTAAGAINQDSPGTYLDSGTTPINVLIETAWLKPSDALEGFARIKRLFLTGQYVSSGSLLIEVGYDYNDTYAVSATINPTSALAPSGNAWELRFQLPIQKCAAIRFRITDSPTAGGGLNFSAMSLKLGAKKGGHKLPAGQKL